MAAKKDLTVDVGTTFTLTLEYRGTDGNPIDLTGYTATFTIRKQGQVTGPALATVTTGFTITGGTIQMKVSDETTSTWTFPLGYYTFVIESPTGDKTRLLQGVLKVDDGVR